jgi:beta-carotene 3-hydroxylase
MMLFFIIFAIPGDTLMILGASKNYNLISWIGLEVALYGLIYLLIHEIYIHRRFRFTKNQKFIS